MVKIHAKEDCGNAPKKIFVQDLLVAIVNNDETFISKHTTDDLRWNIAGGASVEGKDTVLTALRQHRSDTLAELTIHTIVTHGYHGVAEGLLKYKDGRQVAFCDVYQFKASANNAPVKAITTYAVGTE
ncbi:hypothetical protein ECE50_005155 [Chitinophaga sp. Mgbs1]|uniref:Nuclear transport factor 2 family protein n=1 Tax=Chitinophaga solisilvae TaxID=1233460 RepID=A0A9Q5D1X3_9BACT|nr:hypothetical protein [Chitinophaga solisilvae]